MKSTLIFSSIAAGIVVLLTVAFGIAKFNAARPIQSVICTMEAKVCPDGSAVGRSGPDCQFAACPAIPAPAPAASSTPAATTTATSTLANPASANCAKFGGTLAIQKNGQGAEYGLCYFDDNRACEEWAMLRGDCPVGGRKTTGYDAIDQKYCAWSGGETFAVPDSVCTFKNGSKCPTIDFYNGKCSPMGQ